MIVTPVNWYQVPGGLKAMIDRLVCADGGNPDPTSTGGKDAQKAKDLEMKGWPHPRHLAGRAFSGDAAELDRDKAFQEGTRNAARVLIAAVTLLRQEKLAQPDARLRDVRPK